jgi:tripartite-type tricarboxylate transporter receptor subunit TctC
MLAPEDIGRSLFAPPGVPPDRVKVLREGFMKMMKDPDVAAEAQKRRFEPNPLSGDEIEGLLRNLVQSPEVIERMKTFLQN